MTGNSVSSITVSDGNCASIATRALPDRLKRSGRPQACWLYIQRGGAKSVSTASTDRRSLAGGGVVGGEQRAAHNVAMLVDAVDPAARRVDWGKGAIGNAAAVTVALHLRQFRSALARLLPPGFLSRPAVAASRAFGCIGPGFLALGLGRGIAARLLVRLDVGLPLLALQPVDLVAKLLPLAFQRCISPRQPFEEVQQSFDDSPPCAVAYLRGVLVNGVYFSL
jgi:hypothetical protein